MVHDDDTGPPVHVGITDDDYPSRGRRSAKTPSAEVTALIIELAQQPGWGPHGIVEFLKSSGYSVSVSEVRKVIADARLPRR